MYTVYALKSIKHNRIYVGMTGDIERRLSDHNKGYNKSTRPYCPFNLFYTESCESSLEARQREKYLKSGVGKEFLKGVLAGLSTDR